MSSYDYLTDLFGIDLTESEPKKAPAKKASKPEPKKAPEKKASKKPAVKKDDKIVFPLTVLTGICPPTVLTKEQAGDADTLEKIAVLICKQTGVPRKIAVAKRFSESKVAVVLDRGKAQAKGELDITPTSCVMIDGEQIALGELEGKRTVEELNDFITKQTNETVSYQFIADGEKLFAVVGENVAVGPVTLPVTIKSALGDLIFDPEEFEGETEVDMDDIRDKVFESEKYQELESIIEFSRPSKPQGKSILYLTLKKIVADAPKVNGPVKEMYPTNAVISLIFHKIPLSPEMFGGREEVEAKDIIAFLAKDYPEFTEARTKLTYEKEGNYIFPTLKSSSKGAVTYGSREECLAAAEKCPEYFLGNYMENYTLFRYEKTPVSVTEAAFSAQGRFQWNLPKLPRQILDAITEFFERVAYEYEVEALVQIGYLPEYKRYRVVVPNQKVSKCKVHTDDMMEFTSQCYHVMDIHSHNTMPAFFSQEDNEDEVASRVYGVMGYFGSGTPDMVFRAATGGKFVTIDVSDVFDEAETEETYPTADQLFDTWLDYAAKFE